MRNIPAENSSASSAEDGFSLVEALIATGLTLAVISAATGAFTQAVRLADTSRISSETNQSIQAALSLMVRDLIQTGQGIPKGGIPIPSGLNSAPVNRPGPPGSSFTFPGTWTTMPALAPGNAMGPTLLGVSTDAVTVLYADPTLALNQYPLTAIDDDTATITVDNRTVITGADGLHVGDLILFANPLGNALRMVTHLPGTQQVVLATSDPMNLNQVQAAQGTLWSLRTAPSTYPPTTATRILMATYYVDAVTDPAVPRLVRQTSVGARLAIALGFENLQMTYDLIDGTTNPTNVDTPAVANSANQIRKVNLFVSARSLDRNPQTQQYFRNSMATEVGLRSLSFVDRYK